MNLEEFKEKFQELKNEGFIKSRRRKSTGIGFTFETLMGIDENNLALPDIECIEIKTHREHSKSMITLFTFNKGAWKKKPLEVVKKYGKLKKGRLKMYDTMSSSAYNSQGLFLGVNSEEISVKHISGEVIVVWKLSNLVERFLQKVPALLFISVRTEKRDGIEYFHFHRGQFMRGTVTKELLSKLFKSGNLLVDLRLHAKGTKVRNHGTAFRIPVDNLPLLFTKIEDI